MESSASESLQDLVRKWEKGKKFLRLQLCRWRNDDVPYLLPKAADQLKRAAWALVLFAQKKGSPHGGLLGVRRHLDELEALDVENPIALAIWQARLPSALKRAHADVDELSLRDARPIGEGTENRDAWLRQILDMSSAMAEQVNLKVETDANGRPLVRPMTEQEKRDAAEARRAQSAREGSSEGADDGCATSGNATRLKPPNPSKNAVALGMLTKDPSLALLSDEELAERVGVSRTTLYKDTDGWATFRRIRDSLRQRDAPGGKLEFEGGDD